MNQESTEKSPAEQRRANHRISARARIVAAARSMFEQHGAGVSVAQIASEARLSVGAIYLSFDSKEEILAVLLLEDIAAGAAPLDAVKRFLPRELVSALSA